MWQSSVGARGQTSKQGVYSGARRRACLCKGARRPAGPAPGLGVAAWAHGRRGGRMPARRRSCSWALQLAAPLVVYLSIWAAIRSAASCLVGRSSSGGEEAREGASRAGRGGPGGRTPGGAEASRWCCRRSLHTPLAHAGVLLLCSAAAPARWRSSRRPPRPAGCQTWGQEGEGAAGVDGRPATAPHSRCHAWGGGTLRHARRGARNAQGGAHLGSLESAAHAERDLHASPAPSLRRLPLPHSLLLQGHHDFHGVQGVSTQVHELAVGGDLRGGQTGAQPGEPRGEVWGPGGERPG